ncbi:MAG: hypothetical protein Kow009_03860 [Spirochaetales bacterium]
MALQSKLILGFSILLALFTLQWFLFVDRVQSLLTEEKKERAEVLVRTLAELAREPLVSLQLGRIDQQLQSIRMERDVVWARVADKNYRVLSDTRKEEEGWILSGPLPAVRSTEVQGSLLIARSPILIAGSAAGMAEIAFSLDTLDAKIDRNRRIFLGIFGFQLMVGIMMFLLLQIQVFRPLGVVLGRIIELPPEPENLQIEVPPHASPEIVSMVRAVQSMRERLVTFQREALVEARFAVMGKLATHMAHEIRNPLEAISGAVELIDAEVASPTAREYLGVIREEIEILNNYLTEVLEVAKPELSQTSRTDLSALIQETLFLLNPMARKRGVSLTFQASPESLSPCRVDRSQMKRVFLNLILNAIEASPQEKEVQVVLQQKEDGVWVWVKDNGGGIPETILPKVFDPYFTTKEEGTGLGLSLSKRIVERHGGSIGISSREGHGTEVWVRLPVERRREGGTNPIGG